MLRFKNRNLKSKIWLIITILCIIPDATIAKNKKQKVHLVWIWQETGDCLWNIAKKYYGNGRKWKKIYNANKDKISDPNIIYPKQKLVIPVIDGTK